MLNILLQSFALTFFLSSSQARDLLGLFEPKPNLPQELNDFLNDVQQHKKDFAFIRRAVQNQKRYDRNYQEASDVMGEDAETRFNLDSDLANKISGEGISLFEGEEVEEEQSQPYNEEEGTIYSEFESSRFRKHYPNERYSRNIRSPIRLRRELEKGFRSEHKLDVNPNGKFGSITTTNQKNPSKSHVAGNHVTTVDEENAPNKKKRKVEISITSNGKLVKHIAEDEDGPKSIVLKIKTDSTSGSRKPSEDSTLTENENYSSPENNENIPNIADNVQNNEIENVGVPMNFFSPKNNLEGSKALDEALPEAGKVNTSHQAVVNPLNAVYNDLKWSHTAKIVDMAQNNFSSQTQGLKHDLNEDKKDDFEKIQDLAVGETGVRWARGKFGKKENQEDDYVEPQDLLGLEAEVTKNILPASSQECATPKKQKTEDGLHMENIQCITSGEEHSKIISSNEENERRTTETIHIAHNKERTAYRAGKQRNFRVEHLAAIRDRKHLPRVSKYKRKRVRQHPKPKKRLDSEVDYYDLSQLYEFPNNAFDYIPSYRRGLKKIDYDYNPPAIQNIDGKAYQDLQVIRKKYKTKGDNAEEEDTVTSNTLKKMPVKKTQNQFAIVNNEQTTEENDDDYDYSDLTDMGDEDEDVSFEEVDIDRLDIDQVADNNNRSENDIQENAKKLVDGTTDHIDNASVIMSVGNMPWEANQALVGTRSRRSRKTKKKKKKGRDVTEPRVVDESKEIREKRASVGEKHKRKRRRRRKRLKAQHNAPSLNSEKDQFQEKPLTDQEKQDIFLRYNPDFQRWPRFIQDGQKFHEVIRGRGLEDYQKYVRQDFVKREGPTSEVTASASSEAESESIQLQSAETEDFPIAASSLPSTDERATYASSSNDESAAPSDSPNGLSKATSREAETSSKGAETLPHETTSTSNDAPVGNVVLVTANSGIFANVTVSELETQQRRNGNTASGAASTFATLEVTGKTLNSTGLEVTLTASNSTPFPINTIVGNLTQIGQCNNMTQGPGKPYEDEIAKHISATVTSVLPLAKEAATESLNLTKEQFLDLDDILVGVLPKDVVLESLSVARGRVRNGLKSTRYNVNLMNFPLSTYNTSAESSILLMEMSNLIKKLRYHSACQSLPTNLQTYLKTITKNNIDDPMTKLKEMNEIDFDNHQSNYVFQSEQSDKIYEKAQVLRDLLRKYQNLPADGKKRVEPVKKYIDSHLAMIVQMGGDMTEERTAPPIANGASTPTNGEKEISAVDADEESKLQGEVKEEGTAFTSQQFGKLVKAVRNVRSDRQVIKRIGEIYGRNTLDKSKEDLIKNNDKGFESPRIINF